jgi:hypothetical protein
VRVARDGGEARGRVSAASRVGRAEDPHGIAREFR